MEIIYKTIDINFHNMRLDQVATSLYQDFSRSQIQRWIISGNLLVNGETLRPKDKVHSGDELSLDPALEDKVSWDGEDIPLNIHYEDEDFLVINKQPGLVMHPGAGCPNGTLANAIAFYYPDSSKLPRCGIVHRLDKDTSGLVVIAKTEKFRSFFVKQLMNREVQKSYEAIVVGQVIGSMSIELGIARDPRNRIKMRASELGREAISHVSLIQFLNGYSHIEVKIETGRTHQIRVHLSSYKHPIIGDHIYNPRNILAKETPKELISQIQGFPRQALHAKSLCFKRMNGKENFEFESCIPDDMQKLISSLQ